MKRLLQTDRTTFFIPLIAFVFLLIYSPSTSPLYIYEGFDSCTFKTIGLGILEGKMPYTDLFDHKGPILFWLNAAGLGMLQGRWGLFILQTIFLSATLILSYKAARLYTSPAKAFAAVLLTFIPAIDFITEGNQCEEYMLPLIAASIFLGLRYTTGKTNRHPLKYSLFYGLATGIIFFIRPNDAVSHTGAVMAGIFFLLIARKEYLHAVKNALSFLCGFAIAVAPVLLYFHMNGTLADMLHGTILYNLNYSSESGLTEASIGILAIPTIIYTGVILLSRKRGDRTSSWIFIPTLLLTLLLIGKRDYYHYALPIIPTIVIFFSLCLSDGYRKVAAVICVLFAIFSFRQHVMLIRCVQENDRMEHLYKQTSSLIDNVPQEERHQIWNHNLYKASEDRSPHIYSLTGIWTNAGISPANRVFIHFHRGHFGKEAALETHRPEWVLAGPCDQSEEDKYLKANYSAVDSTDADCITKVTLYQLK